MTNVVTICNQALSHLGSEAQVASLDPPDGSSEAGWCARFYPVARRELIAWHLWGFATKREQLAQISVNPSNAWAYAYQRPSDCIRPFKLLSPNSDLQFPREETDSANFQQEGKLILANEPEAVLLYTRDIVDTTQFEPMFVSALGYLLASYLAGPIIRGREGATASAEMRNGATSLMAEARMLDSNSSVEDHSHVPHWIASR